MRLQLLTVHLPWVEGQALHSAHCQQELVLRHAAELHQAQADGGLVVVQLKNTAQRKGHGEEATEYAVQSWMHVPQ